MGTKTLGDLPVAASVANADISHVFQGSVSKSITMNLLAEFVSRNSDWADVISTVIADVDYAAADLEQDHKLFVNPTAGDITLGLFNGSTRDGAMVLIQVVGVGNSVYVEAVTTGVTSHTLLAGDTMMLIWDDTNSEWLVLSNISAFMKTLLNDVNALEARATLGVSPPGVISPYAGSSAPSGYLLCDGAEVSRTTYADLFAVISTTFGVGDGSTTFNLPDMRGIFPRGAGTNGTLGSVGGSVGDYQDFAIENITGNFTAKATSIGGDIVAGDSSLFAGSADTVSTFSVTHNVASESRTKITFNASTVVKTDDETRPANLSLNYIIKI